MDPARFGIYTTIGCIPWTIALAWAGYAVGAHWQGVANGFHGPTYVIAALVVIVLAIAAWRYVRRHAARSVGQPGRDKVAGDQRPRAGRPS